jgi:outer membrane protein assembly factor BamB
MKPRCAILLLSGLILAGCEDSWFGTGDEGPRLEGERIAVMTFGRGLEADPRLAGLEVRLPAPYVNDAWSQTGGSPSHAMYHLSLTEAPAVAWRSDIGAGESDDRRLLAQPLVVEKRVYTMDSRSLVSAYDSEHGKRIWRIELEPEDEDDGFFGGGIAHDAGRLYATTGFGMVYALKAEDGEVLWSQQLPGPIRAAPTVSGGRVFAITIDNQTFALAASDGRRLWEHSGIQETASLLGAASPAVSGSSVVVPYSSGEIFSLLAENGRVLWNDGLSSVKGVDPMSDLAHIRAQPVIDRGVVLAISHSGRMVATDLRRGARAWDVDLGGVQMPWVAGEFVYLVTTDAKVVCLTRRGGRVRWVLALPRFEDPEDLEDPIRWFGPVLAGDRLILVGSTEVAVSVSPYTGKLLGEVKLPGAPAVAPVVADNTLYVITEGADLVALR